MMGLAAARARCDQQRLRVQQAQHRVQWWHAQTRAAAVRAAVSPVALLAAAFAGWWVGKRGAPGQARVEAKARINWQSVRQLCLQALRLWTFWRGVQMTLGIGPARRGVVGARQDRARPDPSATAHSGPMDKP